MHLNKMAGNSTSSEVRAATRSEAAANDSEQPSASVHGNESLPNIVDMSREELKAAIEPLGIETRVSKQIWHWLHSQNVSDFIEMLNVSRRNQKILASNFALVASPDAEGCDSSRPQESSWVSPSATRLKVFKFRVGSTQAVVDVQKLRCYCLNAEHPRGHHKARVFQSALGWTAGCADYVRSKLLEVVQRVEPKYLGSDDWGDQYTVDFIETGPSGQVPIRSFWMVRHSECFPRLTTLYCR